MQQFKAQKSCSTEYWNIHIAGNYDDACRAARAYTFSTGMCFQITKCTYVYTGGTEEGVLVRVIKYPRFDREILELHNTVLEFAQHLANALHQKSYTVEDKRNTTYYTSTNPLHAK